MKINFKSVKMKWAIPTLFIGLALLGACSKDVKNPLDGKGSAYFRLEMASSSAISSVNGFNVGVTAMDAKPATNAVFLIHRDANSAGDLNKTVTVDFALDPTYLDNYNTAAKYYYDTAKVNDSTAYYNFVYDLNMHFDNPNNGGKSTLITAANYDSLHTADPADYDALTYDDWVIEVSDYAASLAGPHGDAYAASVAPIQYEILPAAVYSFTADGLSGSTLTFAPGEATKELKVNIDPLTLSFTTAYALPLTVSNPTGGYKISSDNPSGAVGQAAVELLNQIIVKNQYDGIYKMGGAMGRYAAADGSALNDGLDGPMQAGITTAIVTAGSTTDILSPMHWASGGGVGGVGATASPRITINPDNSIVLDIVDGGATPANWGPIAGKPNKYDPATRTFYINWKWGATAPSPSGTTRAMYYVLEYKGPR